MLNVLIVYAVEEEKVHVEMPNCTFRYCRTGIGKVPAAMAVEKAVALYHPDLVMNIGTAGTINYEIGSVHLCCKFVDRDMEKLSAFGIACEEDFSKEVADCTFLSGWNFDSVCNTGDSFLTQSDGTGDVFDMESYAVAKVCRSHNIPFIGIKCVTDIIGQNSVKHWEEKLAEAQQILQEYINTHPLSVPEAWYGREVQNWIVQYDLQTHPEGGWFKEVYRSSMMLYKSGLPETFPGNRNALTSIYYLLANSQVSAFHRIKSPEIWYFHKGFPLLLHVIDLNGDYSIIEISDTKGGQLQYTIEAGCWFAAEVKDHYGYSFVSCAVAPGFDFDDFELGSIEELNVQYPNLKFKLSNYLFK